MLKLDPLTIVSCVVILAFVVIFWFYTKTASPETLRRKERTIDAMPSIVSTLGVFGTFLGITVGLMHFNVDDLTTSVPKLLDGLKTAFFTSLCGMVGSLLLRHLVTDRKYEAGDVIVSDTLTAQMAICNAMTQMKNAVVEVMQTTERSVTYLSQTMNTAAQKNEALLGDVKAALDGINALHTQEKAAITNITEIAKDIKSTVRTIGTAGQNTYNCVSDIKNSARQISGNVDEISENIERHGNMLASIDTAASTTADNVKEANSRVGELLDIEEGNATTIESTLEETKKFSQVLRGEVDEIEQKMTETNALLTKKFDEFSELLKKSNTEALVEVMKRVTEEFQTQMNALISRLIQENFEKLNQSVEKLNEWQQENKAMIDALTKQYKAMAADFDGTSTVLAKVSADTKTLTGEGSKLQRLINELQKVMIDDKKFTEITGKLESAVSLTKSNMQSFDETTHKLNEWVKRQHDFNTGVQVLIAKLDELNKIRDYGEQFWRDTKQGMNEGVGILKEGTKQLNSQLTDMDRHFYTRLSTTLSELDKCIAAMIDKVDSSR